MSESFHFEKGRSASKIEFTVFSKKGHQRHYKTPLKIPFLQPEAGSFWGTSGFAELTHSPAGVRQREIGCGTSFSELSSVVPPQQCQSKLCRCIRLLQQSLLKEAIRTTLSILWLQTNF